jgi:hypothetical protein
MMAWVAGGGLAVGSLVYGATNSSPIDVGTMVAAYGVAAPFALLCWWQMNRSNAKVDKLEEDVKALHEAAVAREKEFAQRLAPLLYDGAMLYRQGNEQLTKGLDQVPPSELKDLVGTVRELVDRLGER